MYVRNADYEYMFQFLTVDIHTEVSSVMWEYLQIIQSLDHSCIETCDDLGIPHFQNPQVDIVHHVIFRDEYEKCMSTYVDIRKNRRCLDYIHISYIPCKFYLAK